MPSSDPSNLPLRDIHLPDAVSWWPLAPGWWLLLFALITILITTVYLYRKRQCYLGSAGYSSMWAIEKLKLDYQQHNNVQQLVRGLSELLRRVAISIYPREDTASLVGEDWLKFLDQAMLGEPFSKGVGRVLLTAPYQKEITVDVGELVGLTEEWIHRVLSTED